MKRTQSSKLIEKYQEKLKIHELFDSKNLNFELFIYEKGEIIASPLKPLEYLLFICRGKASIYGTNDNGEMFPVSISAVGNMLGNCEFCKNMQTPFIVECQSETHCLALSIKKYKNILDNDIRFLHTLINSLFATQDMMSLIDLPSRTLEDRLLAYLEHVAPNQQLESITAGILHLHCSRRQLQRVVKKLCDEGKLIKVKKGCYKKI